MKYKLFLFFFILTTLSLAAQEIGHTFEYQELKCTVIGENSVSVTGTVSGGYYGDTYIMPDSVYDMDKAYTVVSIGAGQGRLMEYKGIVMGGSWLGIHADTLCLPTTLKEIGDYGLAGMSFRRVIIPDGLEHTGLNAIYGCLNLDSIWLPASLKKIGESLLQGDEALKYVSIPDGVTEIGWAAFSGCSTLTDITVPEGVNSIGEYAFRGCTSLKSFSLPRGITTIMDGVFENCNSLTEIDIPASVTDIERCAFRGSGLGSIVIPNSVTSIGDSSAFAACRYLRSVTLSSGLTRIPPNTFRGCPLTSIIIPENIQAINYGAFSGCDFLNTITVKSQTPPILAKSAFSNYNATVCVPRGCRSTYERADGWSLFANIVEEEEESGSFYLTVAQPSWTVGFKVQEGHRQELRFTPDDSWRIHSVSFNGTDVTALLEAGGIFTTPAIHADAIVAVVFEQEQQAVAAPRADSPRVRVSGQTVYVSGCRPSEAIRMYSADGLLIYTAYADGQGRATVTAAASGIVILSAGSKQFKFVLHV